MPETPIDVHPVSLREGDLLLADPDDPRREVGWRITRGAYPEPVAVDVQVAAERVARSFVVDYVTGDGVDGTHAFFPPILPVRIVPAPGTAADKRPDGAVA